MKHIKAPHTSVVFGAAILLALSILIAVAIVFRSGIILRYDSPKALRLLAMAIAPPDDLFNYSVNAELDISQPGTSTHEFTNKYAGRYGVGILLDEYADDLYFSPRSQRMELTLNMEIAFYVQQALISATIVGSQYTPFLGLTGNGFCFATYDCPAELPLGKAITCVVRVVDPDPALAAAYGPARFYIRKMSDK